MKNIIGSISRIAPEIIPIFERRYKILKVIEEKGIIGRRRIAFLVKLKECMIRTELDFLHKQNYICITPKGVSITDEGIKIVVELEKIIAEISGIKEMSRIIKEELKLDEVIISISGAYENPETTEDIGKIAARRLEKLIKNDDIITLTGGTSIKSVVDNFKITEKYENIMILPSRGGTDFDIEIEANILSSRLANKLNAKYKMLHVPVNMSHATINSLLCEQDIIETLKLMKKTNIILFGIGVALDTAIKRGLSEEEIQLIKDKKGEGEAFGCYFDFDGNVIFKSRVIGMSKADVHEIPNIIAIAKGKHKSKAIIATMRHLAKGILIIDEDTAHEVIYTLNVQNN